MVFIIYIIHFIIYYLFSEINFESVIKPEVIC